MQESSDTVFANVFEPVRDPDQACLLGSDDSNETLCQWLCFSQTAHSVWRRNLETLSEPEEVKLSFYALII